MVEIRKAKLKDVSELTDMWVEFMKYHDNVVISHNSKIKVWLAKRKDAKTLWKKHITKSIRSKNSVVHVAEDKGKLVAYSLISIKPGIPVFKVEKLGHFNDLYVSKAYQGTGISTKFKDLAITWFKKKEVKHATIRVYHDNKIPHSIYKKWGFVDFNIDMRKRL